MLCWELSARVSAYKGWEGVASTSQSQRQLQTAARKEFHNSISFRDWVLACFHASGTFDNTEPCMKVGSFMQPADFPLRGHINIKPCRLYLFSGRLLCRTIPLNKTISVTGHCQGLYVISQLSVFLQFLITYFPPHLSLSFLPSPSFYCSSSPCITDFFSPLYLFIYLLIHSFLLSLSHFLRSCISFPASCSSLSPTLKSWRFKKKSFYEV